MGEKQWEKWMTSFCKPFTTAKLKYFEQGQIAQARAWIESVTEAGGRRAVADTKEG